VLEAGYKIKWSKFIAIAGVAIIGAYLLRTADIGKIFGRGDTHGTSPEPSQTEPKNVTIGRFKCSAKDSAEVKRLTPLDTQGQLETDKADLQAKGRELAALQVQIEAAPSNGVAGQDESDPHNQMADQYNLLQGTYESDATALKQRIDTFNSQTEAHDAYLEHHCVRISP
jgi:hypothetical protein